MKHPFTMAWGTSLPQHDDDLPQRAADLAFARASYLISFEIVPGLAMCKEVPETAKPSAAWTLATVAPLKNIFLNVSANRMVDEENVIDTDFERAIGKNLTVGSFLKGLRAGFKEVIDFADGVDRELTKDLIDKVLTGRHITQHSDPTVYEPWSSPLTPHGRPDSIRDYDKLFRTLPRPPVMDGWNYDSWFAQMRVAGQNPMLLEAFAAIPAKFPVTEEIYAKTAERGDTLASALAEGRLFWLDFKLVAEIVKDNLNPVVGGRKFTPAPIALFGVPPNGGTLRAIAIQAGQDPAKFEITAPGDNWAWRKAKTAVQVADANYHEMFCHLGCTHLIMEAAALATVRNISERHPLYRLLMPHFEGTMAINNSAAHTMLAPGGVIDLSFGGTLESMIAVTAHAVKGYDFKAAMPPSDFARRGVGPGSKLTDYPYRDDALRIWEAISEWASAYVEHYYEEADIAGDSELAAWSAALSAPVGEGGIGGFEPIASRAGLAEALAMIMFTASAQHSAVNFTQWTDMSYSPGLAGALWTEWKDGDATEQDWLDLLPPLQFGELQAEFLSLLGGVHHTHLGEYRTNEFPYPEMIIDPEIVEGPLAAFRAKLREIEFLIQRENRELTTRSAPYDYLLPSKIPASINI